jgi:hypothetical protein
MIDQSELPEFVTNAVPEMSREIENNKCRNSYDVVRQLFKYTAKQVLAKNMAAAKACLSLAEQLYDKGNTVVRNAIENVYVYSFSHAFFYDEKRRLEVMPLVPATLYNLYKKQVINSHL